MAIFPYTDPAARGLVGGHANSEEWNAVSRIANGDVIGVGQPVSRDGDMGIGEFDGTSALGVTRYTIDADIETGFPQYHTVAVMTMGVMWVAAGDAVAAGDPAGFDLATDRWGVAGVDYPAVPGVEFDSSTTGEGLVKIRINRPTAAA